MLPSSLGDDAATERSSIFRMPRPWGARRLLDVLSAQQASLVRAVALPDRDYLLRSYYVDPDTGKRVAHELGRKELADFLAGWEAEPLDAIREMNAVIARLPAGSRAERYVKAAVDLEILLDRETWGGDGKRVFQGIPGYLMNGYTDMGTLSAVTARNGREKIKVDKERVRSRLVRCKRTAIAAERSEEALLSGLYDTVRRDIKFNELGVEKLLREHGDKSIVLSKYLDQGLGVCRHLSIFYQLYLQEAGIRSRLVKGDLRFYVFSGRHAWNLAWVGERVVLVDVTHPNVNHQFIVSGTSEEDVYREASQYSRSYIPTPDDQNHYKIGL